jgi:glycosyltransferase involved in cell wall biosynthesis
VRICLIVRALPVHRLGGLEFHTMDLARALADLGHEITIVTSRHPEDLPSGEYTDGGIRICCLPKGRPGDYSFSFFRDLKGMVSRLDAESRFDVIHAQEFAALFLGSWPGRLVCTVHGTMFSEVPLHRRHFWKLTPPAQLAALWRYRQRILLHPAFRAMLRRADRLIVDSEFTFRELVRMRADLRSKLTVVPLGIDSSRYQPDAPPPTVGGNRPLTIALLGRLQKMKGLLAAVDAAHTVQQRGLDFRMVIGGRGEYAQKLQCWIGERNLQDSVHMHGPVPPEQVSAFLHGADVFLFPDQTQPAFGLVAVEALLHGLPVIAARSGAIPEVVSEDVGWIYDPWNVNELSGIMERLIRHPELIRNRIESCRKLASKYTAQRMAKETEAVYAHLLQSR